MRALVGLALVSLLVTGILATTGASRPAGSASAASRPAGEGKVMAVVLGMSITDRDIPMPKLTSAPADPGWAEQYRNRTLSGRIMKPLVDRFVRENQLEPTEAELQAATEGVRRQIADRDWRDRSELAEVTAKLNAGGLEAREQRRHESSKRAMEKTIEISGRIQTRPAADGKDIARRLAEWQVPSWKLHRALYRKYGGTVIWQQAGIEAVGAMRTFLEEQQKAGNLKIQDPQFENEFWKYFRMKHPAELKQADPFERPPWEANPAPATQPAMRK
jgi:hypothetical protein